MFAALGAATGKASTITLDGVKATNGGTYGNTIGVLARNATAAITIKNGASIGVSGQDAVAAIADGGKIDVDASTLKADAGGNGVRVTNGGQFSGINAAVTAANSGFVLTTGTVDLPNVVTLTGGTLTSGADAIHADGANGTVAFDNVTVKNGQLLLNALNASTIALSATHTALTGDVITGAGSTVNISLKSSSLFGNVTTGNNIDADAGSAWLMTKSSDAQNLINAGSVGFTAGAQPGQTLTLHQDYTTRGGTIVLNTVLGDDRSLTDKVVVEGNTSGTGFIKVLTALGTGSRTVDGIEIVRVGGASDATFILSQRVAAGAYEYGLFKGTPNEANGNWYLRNTIYPGPVSPPTPPPPVVGPVVPPPVVGPKEPVLNVRPEVPVSMAIMPLATEYGYAMLGTLHERGSETGLNVSDPVSEERIVRCENPKTNFRCVVRVPAAVHVGKDATRWAASGWARLFGNRGFNDADNFAKRGPDYDYTFGGIQAGLDIYAREQGDGTLDKAGISVGYGQITSDVKGQFGGKAGNVDTDAYTVGGYWTHRSATGWYTDAVVQGTLYATEAHSIFNQRFNPDGFGLLGSLEGGYAFKLGNGLTLEPQAQIVAQNVSFDNARDAYGFVRFDDGDSLRGRLGLRLTKTWNRAESGQRLVTAWLRANVWHEFLGKTRTTWTRLDGREAIPFNSYFNGTWGEFGAGVTAPITEKVNLFATAAYQHSLDNKGRVGWDGRLGMNVKW